MNSAVSVQGLKKSFGETEALRGLSFTVEKGEVFGLVGPDGAGKTTAMRILAAILSPDQGSVEVLGNDPVKDPGAVHDRTAYMSQRFGLYEDLSVEENLAFYGDLYGVGRSEFRKRARELLEWSGLERFRKRRAGKLSGGMKQKLGLSCALVHTPELLLLDEPTNGVDPVSRREFWNMLYRLVQDGLTIVTSTSYLDEAERCSRLLLLDRGKTRATGTPLEIKAMVPGGVKAFRSDDPFREAAELSKSTGSVCSVFGSEVHLMGHRGSLSREFTEKQATVEDAFIYLSAGNDG